MSKRIFAAALVALVLTVPSVVSAGSQWTYVDGAITCDDWTFSATVNGTDMTVGECTCWPSNTAPLDFSLPVTDGSQEYDIVSLQTYLGAPSSGYCRSLTTEAGLAVSSLVLPDTGKLTTIGERAFGQLNNCTSVTPYIPDSVTSLGGGAFMGCAAQQDVRLVGVVDKIDHCTFRDSKITSVTFGPDLKVIWGTWTAGSFQDCTLLTNVTFDAAMTGCKFDGILNNGAFAGCSSLAGTIDLRGFSELCQHKHFDGTKIDTVLLGENLTRLDSVTFDGMTSLESVKFYGAPPATLGTPVFGSLSANQIIATYVMSEDESVQAQWAALTSGGTIDKTTSVWHPDYVASGASANRYLLLPTEAGGDLGDWIYEDQVLRRADDAWEFNAVVSFNQLEVRDCIKNPGKLDELDFTLKITDTNGLELHPYAFNTAFTVCGSDWGYFNGTHKINDGAQYVGRLVLPSEGVQTIGRGAFANCTALTNVVNYLPDSVTYLGVGAFYKVPAQQDLRLYGVPRVDYATFRYSGVTSVTFGPDLATLRSFYENSTFGDSKSLTNVWFDAGMHNATLDSSSSGVFENCSALAGRLDLSGFSGSMGGTISINNCKLTEIVFADAVSSLANNFINCQTITNVIFKGRPPETLSLPYLNGMQNAKVVKTTLDKNYVSATNAAGMCWLDYAANHEIWGEKSDPARNTTWAAENVHANVPLANRQLVAPGRYPGIAIIVR